MIIELLSEGKYFYYFYFIDESDKNKYKGGWVGMLMLAYGDKYWRENQATNQNFIEWGDDIAQKILEIKKSN